MKENYKKLKNLINKTKKIQIKIYKILLSKDIKFKLMKILHMMKKINN